MAGEDCGEVRKKSKERREDAALCVDRLGRKSDGRRKSTEMDGTASPGLAPSRRNPTGIADHPPQLVPQQTSMELQ